MEQMSPFFQTLAALASAIADHYELSFALLTAAVGIWIAFRRILPSWRLLRASLFHDQPFAGLRAARELLLCLYYRPRTESLFDAARLRIETEILHPRPVPYVPPAPVPARSASPTERRQLRQSYREKRALAAAEHKKHQHEWRQELKSRLSELVTQSRDGAPVIPVATCFDLYDAREHLQRYFEALAVETEALGADGQRFLSRVEISSGFLAPLHLLTGLLPHFGENWKPVIEEYGQAVTRPDDPLGHRELRAFQTFLFDCWLVWGPSIPICSCQNWNGSISLQYGYGDENNSVPLFSAENGLLKRLDELIAARGRKERPLAHQVRVIARPQWGRGNVCAAQDTMADGLVLECESAEAVGGEQAASAYYSAYLWIMFVILDDAGRLLFPHAERWRGLLPFFEHGNLANRATYIFLKEQLARKAVSAIDRIVAEGPWRFAYACAVDDSACGQELRFPYDTQPLSATVRRLAKEHPRLEGRLVWSVPNDADHVYSACHLPDVISDFYESIRGRADA